MSGGVLESSAAVLHGFGYSYIRTWREWQQGSVLQCVAVCCSVLQCVAVNHSELQCFVMSSTRIWEFTYTNMA